MIKSFLGFVSTVALLSVFALFGASIAGADEPNAKTLNSDHKDGDRKEVKHKASKAQWKQMKGEWEVCQFGGDGEVTIKDGKIKMDYGDPITGVRWSGDVLKDNYEIELEAQRLDGFDFLCALTLPIGEKGRASLVMGGWGGGTLGISSIDDRDASDNDTTMFRNFKNNIWYKARVRVETTRIAVWIDDTLMFDHPRKDHTFDIRYEMDPCLPLGIANFQCLSEIRNVRVRALAKQELGEKLKSKKPKKDSGTDKDAKEIGDKDGSETK